MEKKRPTIAELEKEAVEVRKDIIRMLGEAGSGHPGGSLSSVEIMMGLYYYKMRHNPKKPDWPDRDRFILSKGHVCPALYTVMARCGYFPREEMMTLRKFDSRLQGHPHMLKLPGLEVSCGSLGQGLSVANGIALGARLDKKDYRVYCLMGDGEVDEGQVWEAAMTSSHYNLDNLCGIVDRNRLQIDGFTEDVMKLDSLVKKWDSFGWNVIEIDGHNIKKVMDAYDEAEKTKGKPTMVIANTIKGKGVSFMENKAQWHGVAPKGEQIELALKELDMKPTQKQLEEAEA
jgi:transketolase